MTTPLTSKDRKQLKSRAQRLDPVAHIGKAGLSPALIKAVDEALARHELIKVKFDGFKEQKRELAPELATQTASELVTLIGNVAVLFRKRPEPVEAAAE